MSKRNKTVFYEKQYIHLWIRILMFLTSIMTIFSLINALLKDYNTETLVTAIVVSAIMILATALILAPSKIYIDEDGIQLRYFMASLIKPIYFNWNEIESIKIRNYNALREFGGWGYRFKPFSRKRTKAVVLKGNVGLELHFSNSKIFFIGTQRQEELEKCLLELGKLPSKD